MPARKFTQEEDLMLRVHSRKTSYKEWIFYILTGIYVSAIPICIFLLLFFKILYLVINKTEFFCSFILARCTTPSDSTIDWWIMYRNNRNCHLSSCFCISERQVPREREACFFGFLFLFFSSLTKINNRVKLNKVLFQGKHRGIIYELNFKFEKTEI